MLLMDEAYKKSLPPAPKDSSRMLNSEIFAEYCKFAAMPHQDKCEYLGIEKDPKTGRPVAHPTQTAFGKKWGISNTSLTLWKARPEYTQLVLSNSVKWSADKVPDVIAALYRRCLQYGMAYDVEMYLKWAINWDPHKLGQQGGNQPFTMDDIRTIVAVLPREKQAKFYATIADIIADAEVARSRTEVSGDIPVIIDADQGHVRGQADNAPAPAR